MNWIKENKFITGFFAVMLVGLSVLGYFLFSAMGGFDEATTRYNGLATELDRLQSLPVSPSQKNLTALGGQKDEAVKAIAAFQSSLAAKSFPVEPMTPEQFQDKLKATKNSVTEKAQGTPQLPAKFFLGFDVYETRPPDKDAAAPLGHELKAIEWIFMQLIESKVTEVKSIKRDPLPEESGKGRSGDKADKKGKALVNSHPVEIAMHCQQKALAPFLNTLISPKAPQFYIVRTISVKSQSEKGPQKVAANTPPPPPPTPPAGTPPTGAAPAPAQPQAASTYIVGEEQIDVTLQIEIVDFAEPTPTSAK